MVQELQDKMPRDPRWPDMILSPHSSPISKEQLAAEVKSIYAGLIMVEHKCIHVDRAQALKPHENDGDDKVSNEYWQALVALYRTLLHEHYDFFLASQHPSASPTLRRLASKYSMPARLWKHGIHSFFELLSHCLPDSQEFMISFIYEAYRMMSILYETVTPLGSTWIECLGDVGRYRMAIETEDAYVREQWATVAGFWYMKAVDITPDVGRLYHHLAILARTDPLRQLSLYSRSLASVKAFDSARESILTLFDPILQCTEAYTAVPEINRHFIKAIALLFKQGCPDTMRQHQERYLELLNSYVKNIKTMWQEQGAFVAITLICVILGFGHGDAPLRQLFDKQTSTRTDFGPECTIEMKGDARRKYEAEIEDGAGPPSMTSSYRTT
jgi:hypothetical protein